MSFASYRFMVLFDLLLMSVVAMADQTSSLIQIPRGGYLRADSGLAFLGYNDVSIPDNSTSDRFSLRDLIGTGPNPFLRLSYEVPLDNGGRGLRFVIAFLDDAGTGFLTAPARIGGKTLQPNVATRAYYRFNGYRATYWWRLREDQNSLVRIGATLNIRDATVDVRQPGAQAYTSNIGPVPLLYFQIDHRLSERLKATFETDAFAVPGGRAIDANARLAYSISSRTDLSLGVRALDGLGDEPGDVFSSIRYYYATVGLGYKF